MSIRSLVKSVLLFLFCCAAVGCTVRDTSQQGATGPYRQTVGGSFEGDALVAGSFVAADGLAANLKNRVPEGTRILAATFVDRENFESSSPFGRLVSSQVVSRLVQAGYDVMEIRLRKEIGVRAGEGEFALTRETARLMQQKFDAEAILAGCYTVDAHNVFVAAQVVRLDDGVIVSAYDWALPNRGVVSRLLSPKAPQEDFERLVRAPLGEARPMAPVKRVAAPAAPVRQENITDEAPAKAAPATPKTQGEIFRLFPPQRVQ